MGVYLGGAAGTALTNATLDFVPNGGVPVAYENVADAKCNACHGRLSAHGGRRVGVKLCVTCHTWLLADPDTSDTAALDAGASATRTTYPNPMEMGRLVHRIHRGKNLPTLYLSSNCSVTPAPTAPPAATWPAASPVCNVATLAPTFPPNGPPASQPALPFRPGRNALGPVGTKSSIIGFQSTEFVVGKIANRFDVNTLQGSRAVAEGVGFPQDLRNCGACHSSDPRTGPTVTAISRRTCSGCHPDVWYGPVAAPSDLDPFHLPHSGGPQADDSACRDCHVTPRAGGPSRWVPIAEAHVAPSQSVRFKKPVFAITDVQDLRPGTPGTPGTPGPANSTIKFKVWDGLGAISPLNAPSPAWDTAADPAERSPVPRKMTSLTIRIGGPNSDFLTGGGTETVGGTAAAPTFTRAFSYTASCNPTILSLTADPATDEFTCTFPNPFANLNLVPGKVDVKGFWTVGIEGRRASSAAALVPPVLTTDPWYAWSLGYDIATDSFRWPFTGEAVTEGGENVFVSIDPASGRIATDPSAARRAIVSKERCNGCHLRLAFHGGTRTDPKQCLFCHAPDATDWMYRPRDLRVPLGTVATGQVLLWDPLELPANSTKAWTYATADGIEERSISLKTMIHRIHTGEREGAASLEGIRPFVIHAGAARPAFLDDIRYPNDLANCEVCHLSDTWTIESVPSDAAPTTANERGTILHTGTAASMARPGHTSSSELKVGAVTSACLTCHTNGAAADHAAGKTVAGVEQCGTCHGENGAESVRRHHAVP